MKFDTTNNAFAAALDIINNTSKHLFVYGKAGSGKTTFLRALNNLTYKRLAVVAPTGVAAVNAQGMTIHKMVNLPLGPYFPDNPESLANIRLDRDRRTLIDALELLVIDEVSMLRADLLDALDHVFRRTRNVPELPFGGVQMLYIGDLYQLPPVVTQTERQLFQPYYHSLFFIDSHVYRQSTPICLRLEKNYRQTDLEFINLLNSIRNGTVANNTLEELYVEFGVNKVEVTQDHVVLTTHNLKAQTRNNEGLKQLQSPERIFDAAIQGEVEEDAIPAERQLRLKVGARVMLLRNKVTNTEQFYNGKIGIVKAITDDIISVDFGNEGTLNVERETWEAYSFNYDTTSKSVDRKVIGTFVQFPLRLAWAITIHKSQGLTFEKAAIDAIDSFSPGQVYVALSRLKSKSGLTLLSPLRSDLIKIDPRVIEFENGLSDRDSSGFELEKEQKAFVFEKVKGVFDWSAVVSTINNLSDTNDSVLHGVKSKAISHQKIAAKFCSQIDQLFAAPDFTYKRLADRLSNACTYFQNEIEKQLIPNLKAIQQAPIDIHNRHRISLAKAITTALQLKRTQLKLAYEIGVGLAGGLKLGEILLNGEALESKAVKKPKQIVSDMTHLESSRDGRKCLELFKRGMSISDIALQQKLTAIMVEKHLASYLPSGEVKITDIVPQPDLDKVLLILNDSDSLSLFELKQRVGEQVSFGQLAAAMSYFKLNQ